MGKCYSISKEVHDVKADLAITKKALELACKMIDIENICDCKPITEPIESYLNRVIPDYCQDNCDKGECTKTYFITKAKEATNETR